MTKKSYFRLFTVLILSFSFLTISCKSKSEKKLADPAWAEFIKAHTTGQISKESMIRVVFNQEMVDKEKVGKEADDIFDFDPSIDGKAEWSSTNEITFIPEENLPSGKQYKVELDLEDLLTVPEKLKNFFFYFETITQDFDFSFEGLKTPDIKKLDIQQFNGTINTADVVDNKELEKILTTEQSGSDLKITWQHNENRKQHNFTISNIKRSKEPAKLIIEWDGDSIDVDKEGKTEIDVPARGIFKITNIEPYMTDEQYVIVRFSDPLKQRQNLSGLAYIQNESVRTTIKDNIIKIYPTRKIRGKVTVKVVAGIRNSENKKLSKTVSKKVTFESVKPGIRFVGKGAILPENEKLTVPFEAANVHSVQVTAFKIYSKNMGQFFQLNNYKGSQQLKRVGRYLWRKTIHLNAAPEVLAKWSRYNLDVTDLFKKHPNSLFRLSLSINRGNSTYRCPGNNKPPKKEKPFKNADDWRDRGSSYWDYSEDYYSSYNDDWSNRKNPCHDAYYKKRYNKYAKAEKNFIASNIGIIAKLGEDKNLHIVTTDIRTAKPISTKIKAYNFQNILMGESETSGSGMGKITLDGKPFYLVAEKDGHKGYLRLNGDSTLPMSHFDVGGEKVKSGIKGYIYGERGVWRPGDKIYLTFVLEDKNKTLPKDHPVLLEMFNPRGQLIDTINEYKKEDNFYLFETKTDIDSITGNYKALVRLGGLTFTKYLKVETVVPNRLRVNLDFGKQKELHSSQFPLTAKLFSQWLHGATASNLSTDVSVQLSSTTTKFSRYKDYIFDDVTRVFKGKKINIFQGVLNATGNAEFDMDLQVDGYPSGKLMANFTSRVFEEGGGFSTETFRIPFHAYQNYVGIKTPKGDQARGMLLTDKFHKVTIASIDSNGKPVSLSDVEVTLYKISWKYWWDKTSENLANFTSARYTRKLSSGVISTKNGIGSWKFKVKYPSWGRYLVRAEDRNGNHSSSKIIYIDWPGWAGRAREEKGVGATRLNFTADKQKYKVGEDAVIYLPSVKKAKALISIENGSKVISQRWVDTVKGKNKFEIELTKEMSPNVYVHVSLLQPHKDKDNDRPIRLYGALPIFVDDPKTILEPELKAPKVLKPLKSAKFKVKEKSGRAMNYTIALVDEGLLGLTRYKTPNLHKQFYKREALGVKTWDLFDDVAGAYGATLERILALGGDGEAEEKKRAKKKRFPPVVKVLGPFKLKSGKTNEHKIKIPQYIGALRAMVVAGKDGAYGSTDKSIPVKQPMMLLATLPRVIGPGENLKIPVSIFVNDEKIKRVSVKITPDKNLKLSGSSKQSVKFSKTGEQIVFFNAKVANAVTKAKVTFKATSGSYSADQEIFIDVRSPNPEIAKVTKGVIDAGKSWKTILIPHGLKNTNSATIEVSTVPPLNLEKRLSYLIRYPHGCLEQTTSSVFPQLYLDSLVELDDGQKTNIEENIKAAISRLRQFQLSSGGFTYWPGTGNRADAWASNYAGHFLVEAEKKGYYVPGSILSPWKRYQRAAANSWKPRSKQNELTQAYRLYTLALAKKPQLGAMNRLRESKKLNSVAKWQLAAAFKLAGQEDAALDLIKNDNMQVRYYKELGNTYGSSLRDKAIILLALTHLEKKSEGKNLAVDISKALSTKGWYSTQTTAYSLLALSQFTGKSGTTFNFSFASNVAGKEQKFKSSSPIFVQRLKKVPLKGTEVIVKNTNSSATLYVMLASKGSPAPGNEVAVQKGLSLAVNYATTNNEFINTNNLAQGTDFVAEITVANTSNSVYENLVLNHVVPSGWQIHNARFETGNIIADVDYQDYRDDRIYTYFRLNPNQTKKFKVLLNASFIGKYYMPAISVEAMYDASSIQAVIAGGWVDIVK